MYLKNAEDIDHLLSHNLVHGHVHAVVIINTLILADNLRSLSN